MSTTTVEFNRLPAMLVMLANRAHAATGAALTSAAMRIRGEVVRRSQTLKSDKGFPGFNTGYFARGWKVDKVVESSVLDSYIRIFNSTPYAGVLEYGRRAGVRPPSNALIPWVRRKLRVDAKRAPGVAFAVARAIGKRAIAGRHYISDPAFQRNMSDMFRMEVVRVLNRYLTTGRP